MSEHVEYLLSEILMCWGNPEDKHTHTLLIVRWNKTIPYQKVSWQKTECHATVSTQHSEMDTDIRDGGSACRFVAMFCQKHPKPKHATSPEKWSQSVSIAPWWLVPV